MRSHVFAFLLALTGVAVEAAESKVDVSQPAKTYYQDHARGWYWYEDPKLEEKKQAEQQVIESAPPLSPRDILKKQGEDYENALALAMLKPTPENYQKYLAISSQIQQQAQDFSVGFKEAIWQSPEFDYTLKQPVTTQAIIAKNEEEKAGNEKDLSALSGNNGLLFFFRSDCPYCHRFAPVLKKFSEFYGFTVIPVSLDGGGLPEYPYPKRNYDLGRKLNVENVPALFMVDPDRNTVATVGYGYSDWSVLTQKVLSAGKHILGK